MRSDHLTAERREHSRDLAGDGGKFYLPGWQSVRSMPDNADCEGETRARWIFFHTGTGACTDDCTRGILMSRNSDLRHPGANVSWPGQLPGRGCRDGSSRERKACC